jgi:hypothetical protein
MNIELVGQRGPLPALRKSSTFFLNRTDRKMHANRAGSDSCEDSSFGEGKAFSAKDFLDIWSRTTEDVALHSLTKEGEIRRIRRGLYDMPKVNPALGGKLSPDIDEAARAIARRQRWKIVPEARSSMPAQY